MEIEYVPDGYLGVRLQPDRVYTLKSGGRCTVDNLGFRGAGPVTIRKPEGRVRIAVVGGSAAFSYETDDDKTWPRLLERMLRARYARDIEVINAGVPGYSTFESKVDYLYQLRQLSPDLVIAYETWNDIKYFRSIDAGNYPRRGLAESHPVYSLLRHLQLAWRVRDFLDETWAPRQRENSFGHFATAAATIADDGAAHRWERKNFEDLAVLLNSDGVIPVLASQAGLLSADNIEDPKIRSVVYTEYVNLTFEELLRQWNAVTEIIRRAADEQRAVFIDVHARVPHDRSMFHDHVHLTEAGGAAVAQALFDGLTRDARVDALMKASRSLAASPPRP
jgi:lysophospholipase L1-like esterase